MTVREGDVEGKLWVVLDKHLISDVLPDGAILFTDASSRKIASGFSAAFERMACATPASCSSVVPKTCMWRCARR